MKPLKRFFEHFIVGLLALSGTITTLTVMLIIIFLFSEGAGVFRTSPLEKHNTLVINRVNPVKELRPGQIKEIFDGNTLTAGLYLVFCVLAVVGWRQWRASLRQMPAEETAFA